MVEEMLEEELSGEGEDGEDEDGATKKPVKKPDDLGWG